MRQLILAVVVSSLHCATAAYAQETKSAMPAEAGKKARQGSVFHGTLSSDTVVLRSTSSNEAYGSYKRFSIADPTIRRLNERANGANVAISSSGVVGMPKGTYGFADGKLLLRSTTAASSGTVYGSGAVGTGTTIMGVGTGENTPGINGKNVNAGPWLWGSKLAAQDFQPAGNRRRKN